MRNCDRISNDGVNVAMSATVTEQSRLYTLNEEKYHLGEDEDGAEVVILSIDLIDIFLEHKCLQLIDRQ